MGACHHPMEVWVKALGVWVMEVTVLETPSR
jgi:hypothetical protein